MELVSVTSTQIADVSNSFVSFHCDLQLQFKNLLLLSCVHTFIAKVVACLLLQGVIEVLGNLYLKWRILSQTSTEESGKNLKKLIFPTGFQVHLEDMF